MTHHSSVTKNYLLNMLEKGMLPLQVLDAIRADPNFNRPDRKKITGAIIHTLYRTYILPK